MNVHSGERRVMLTARLLGRLWVVVDGQVVDTASSRRTRNVLAYLLTHRETPVPRDVLMDVFWGNADPEAARNSVHVALSGVRRALRATGPEPLLERRHDTYRFADHLDVWVDVEAFEQASRQGRRAEEAGDAAAALEAYERAGQLYDGDFLAEDPYAPWAGELRETLRAQANDVACRLVALYGRLGDDSSAVLVGRRVLAGDPCNEPVHRQLMASYARAGQRHLGLLQYQRCREALWTTFRIQPAVETTVLYDSLRGRLPQAAPGNARDRGHLPRPALHAEPGRTRVRV
ncbi:MAG TPA: BTAD domain-containing putative transcriptional regulator [Mycobacteriales bacterium]|nr:BTAD domain-containing putative transcriptional regulator [Mycobacteriales bacterium]